MVVIHFISLIYYSFFKELNIDITSNNISKVAPTHNYIRNIIIDTTTETLITACTKYNSKKLFLSMDIANKDSTYYIVKVIIVWNTNLNHLLIYF